MSIVTMAARGNPPSVIMASIVIQRQVHKLAWRIQKVS
jgi:hypothetical protein